VKEKIVVKFHKLAIFWQLTAIYCLNMAISKNSLEIWQFRQFILSQKSFPWVGHIGFFFHDQVARLCPKEKQMAILYYIRGLTTLFLFQLDFFFLSFFLLEKGKCIKAFIP
jgi:hypothetical protein